MLQLLSSSSFGSPSMFADGTAGVRGLPRSARPMTLTRTGPLELRTREELRKVETSAAVRGFPQYLVLGSGRQWDCGQTSEPYGYRRATFDSHTVRFVQSAAPIPYENRMVRTILRRSWRYRNDRVTPMSHVRCDGPAQRRPLIVRRKAAWTFNMRAPRHMENSFDIQSSGNSMSRARKDL